MRGGDGAMYCVSATMTIYKENYVANSLAGKYEMSLMV